MKKNNIRQRQRQRGLTLIEITIVLILIGIILFALLGRAGGGNTAATRAGAVVQHVKNVADAVQIAQATLGCYPLDVSGLFYLNQGGRGLLANVNNNSCGYSSAQSSSLSGSFTGPYLRGVNLAANGLSLDDISPTLRGNIATAAATNSTLSGGGTIVYYRIDNMPTPLGQAAYARCTNNSTTVQVAITSLSPSTPCGYDTSQQFVYYLGGY